MNYLNQQLVKLLIFIILIFNLSQLNAQLVKNDTIKNVIEKPEFPGGIDSLYKFASKNFKYPKDASEKEIEGIVLIDFVIGKDGKVTKEEVSREIDPSLDAEALRIMSLFPRWKPALKDGTPVEYKYSLEFSFMNANGWFVRDTIKPKSDTLKIVLKDQIQEEDNKEALTFVEKMPEYPGGINALMRFLAQNIKYPEDASKRGVSGRVVVNFVIDKHGKVINVMIIRGIGGGCTNEAVRVVKLMPTWKPGTQNGKVVPVYYTLPIIFQLKR